MPKKEIYVAMLEFEDRSDFQGINTNNYRSFNDAVLKASVLFKRYAPKNSINIFMAPEYTFSGHETNDNGSVSIGSLSKSNKHSLYGKLKKTSSEYKNILIVAGSIAYSKKAVFSDRKYLSLCPVLYDGNIVLKYYKKKHDQFQKGSSFKSFITKFKGSTFTHHGLDFGVEICLDHSGRYKVLKTKVQQTLDIHLLVSAGMAPSVLSIAAREGGLMINCDSSGHATGNGVRKVTIHPKWKRPDIDPKARGLVNHDSTVSVGVKVVLYQGEIRK